MDYSFDYIIAGQGLAGTMLAYFLECAGKKVLLVDPAGPVSSSRIAAGIIHPITGRRIVKTWRSDLLIPFAEKSYEAIGKKSGHIYYQSKPILEIFTSVKHRNDWMSRMSEPGMELYNQGEAGAIRLNGVNMPLGGMLISRSGYLMIDELLNDFRIHLKNNNCFEQGQVLYDSLVMKDEKVLWKNFSAKGIIFCEGAAAQKNPFFSRLPFIPSKGEILTISAPELDETFILNRSLYILPIGNKLFRAGATNEWDNLDQKPTEEAKEKLLRLVKSMITVPFEITDHLAAVRPTVRDRRPFLGTHPEHAQLHIFNGLGTKGVMIAPYFAKHLCDYLVEGNPIDPEVDISRFSGNRF